mgnify:FL=1
MDLTFKVYKHGIIVATEKIILPGKRKKKTLSGPSLKNYQGSLQLKAEGSPTPDTKLCPLSYPFPVARR